MAAVVGMQSDCLCEADVLGLITIAASLLTCQPVSICPVVTVLAGPHFAIMHHSSLHFSGISLTCTSEVPQYPMVWLQEPDLFQQVAPATSSSLQAATSGSQLPEQQQQPSAAGLPKEGNNMGYSLFGDQNVGGNSASWPSIPSSKSTNDAADR